MNDLLLMKFVYEVAAQESTDPSTQNAAILVSKDGQSILCSAANRFPTGVEESAARWERPAKYQFVEHAERNVIYQAARAGIATDGLTMYCPWFACADCGRAIIQAGIKEVVGHEIPEHANNPRWKESIAVALQMFDEAGVKYRHITDRIGGIKVRMNGQEIEP